MIETATAACSVALVDGETVLAHAHEVVGRGHAERLVPMIGTVLAAADADRAEDILVDCGLSAQVHRQVVRFHLASLFASPRSQVPSTMMTMTTRITTTTVLVLARQMWAPPWKKSLTSVSYKRKSARSGR